MGAFADFKDTEGNVTALWQNADRAASGEAQTELIPGSFVNRHRELCAR
jgi:hypothetical protein